MIVEGIDVLLIVIDASHMLPYSDELVLERARRFRGKTILALNKIDRVAKPDLLPLITASAKDFDFAAIVPISALKGSGVDELVAEILKHLPEGDAFFPEDQITDQPARFLAAEVIREKAIQLTYHEVPHALAVFVEKYEEAPKILRIQVVLHVEKDSQKKILIGQKGAMLKKIGTEARKELETLLDTKIFLSMFVKVASGWRDNPSKVREIDWRAQLEALSQFQKEQ